MFNNVRSNRILAKGVSVSNDTWVTGINNNDLVVGPSGGGKTRGYVVPNILHAQDSLIVADTKGNLRRLVIFRQFLRGSFPTVTGSAGDVGKWSVAAILSGSRQWFPSGFRIKKIFAISPGICYTLFKALFHFRYGH